MNRTIKHQIVATLLRSNRRDLAQLFVNATVKVGTEWDSAQGKRRIVKIDDARGIAFIQTGDSRFAQLLPLAEVPDEMTFDAKDLASRQKHEKAEREREEKEAAEKGERENTYGFAEQFGAMRRQKVLDALLKQRSYNGKFMTLKEKIESMYREGYEVKPHTKFKQIAQLGDEYGRFLTQRDLTKTGLDYLRYLNDKQIRLA